MRALFPVMFGEAGFSLQLYFCQFAGEGSHEQFRVSKAGFSQGDRVFSRFVGFGPGFIRGWFAFGNNGELSACWGAGGELVYRVIVDV